MTPSKRQEILAHRRSCRSQTIVSAGILLLERRISRDSVSVGYLNEVLDILWVSGANYNPWNLLYFRIFYCYWYIFNC